MTTKTKLTKTVIAATKPGAADVIVRDTEVPGMYLKVTPSGVKSLMCRFAIGKGRGAPIRVPRIPVDVDAPGSVESARKIAREWRAKGAEGIDPASELRASAAVPTVADLCERWVEEKTGVKRSIGEDKRMIGKLPQSLLRTRVTDVTKDQVRAVHKKHASTPIQANRFVMLLSGIFGAAVDEWEIMDRNPAAKIKKFEENKRERYLSLEEIERLDVALVDHANERGDREGAEAADAFRLLLLTGARSGELLSATWDQFDLEAGVWTKPSSHTKTKKKHVVQLSSPAVALLEGVKARYNIGSRWVFPGRSGGHRLSLKKAWEDLRVRADIADVHIHDLRHSAASLMLSAGVPLDHVGRVLGHTQAQTTLRYAHLTDEAGKAATDALGNVITFKTAVLKNG
jgi:integrase